MSRSILAVILCLAFLLASPAAALERGAVVVKRADTQEAVTLYRKSYALVIGIDAYSNGWDRLENAVKDAKAVAADLKTRGFEVTLKRDLNSRDLEETLRQFFIHKGADRDARLLVWFAGHGHTVKVWENSPEIGYLVPADAPLAIEDDDLAFRRKALPLSRFGNLMREARARHVLAVFDSCFSGTVFTRLRGSEARKPKAITRYTRLPVRQMITAGQAGQTVRDDGQFRRLLLAAIGGSEPAADPNNDGYVTGTELGLFLQQRMTNLPNSKQTPRFGKLDVAGFNGDFVFRTGKEPAPETPKPAPAADLCSDRQHQRAKDLYEKIKETNDRRQFKYLIEKYPHCDHAGLARIALDRLKEKERQTAALRSKREKPKPKPKKPERETEVAVGTFPEKPKDTPSDKFGPGYEFRDCDNCPKMVVVPAGSFMMGSAGNSGDKDERPQHKVSFAKPFAAGKFEITFKEWNRCVADGGCNEPATNSREIGSRPVVHVTWNDAQDYVKWLAKKTTRPYRLLSEAEWEYAARAGSAKRFSWGDKIGSGNANCDICGGDWGNGNNTTPVGLFKANAFGLHDTHGNVWEWVADPWHNNYLGAPTDGSIWSDGGNSRLRVIRGGGFNFNPGGLRTADRLGYQVRYNWYNLGVRVARDLTVEELAATQDSDGTKAANAKSEQEQKVAVGTFPEILKTAPAKKLKPGDEFQDCKDCPKMVVVPSGQFMMGSPKSERKRKKHEGPQHTVIFTKPIAIGKYEVALDEFEAFVRETKYDAIDRCWARAGSRYKNRLDRSFRNLGFRQSGSHPVACMSWNDAKAFTTWLTTKTGKSYRLLSEAEWEYASRGGTTTPFSTGQKIHTDQANFDGNYTYGGSRKGQYRKRTVPIGTFGSNSFGLHEMHGNMWEWVEDCWNDSFVDAPTDGSAWSSGDCSQRILRGGSWNSNPRFLRSASRGVSNDPGKRHHGYGFRVARDLTAEELR